MATIKEAPDVIGAGEYGASTVFVSQDGSSLRMAFGRNGPGGGKVYYGAVLLSAEAAAELKEQLARLSL